MLHELSIETAKSGQLPGLTRRLGEETLALRRQHGGGTFRGAWTAEFGALNSLYVLWEFADAAARDKSATALDASPDWMTHARSLTPMLDRVQTFLLKPHREIVRRPDEGRMYDFRIYDIKPHHAEEYARHLAGVLPVREKHSKNFCVWTSIAGNTHRVVHLWPYDDPDQRLQVRAAVAAEPEWKEFVAKVFPLIVWQRSSLLRPVPNLYTA